MIIIKTEIKISVSDKLVNLKTYLTEDLSTINKSCSPAPMFSLLIKCAYYINKVIYMCLHNKLIKSYVKYVGLKIMYYV